MWAIKIFDDGGESAHKESLALMDERGAGVEVALYSGAGFEPWVKEELERRERERPGSVALHLSHQHLALSDLELQAWSWEARQEAAAAVFEPADRESGSRLSEAARRLAREAAWAREVGVKKAVLHLDRGRGPLGELWWRAQEPQALAARLAPAIRAAKGLGVTLLLEKTYESREWVVAFFDAAAALGLRDALGFAFDMGHARVWEPEPLEGWIDAMLRMRAQGFALHFHLHGNAGDMDSHASLAEAHARGWLDADPVWAPRGAVVELERIEREFGDQAMLVLENDPRDAREALGWVELSLSREA